MVGLDISGVFIVGCRCSYLWVWFASVVVRFLGSCGSVGSVLHCGSVEVVGLGGGSGAVEV
jgi:hypothetical protein